MTDCSKLVNLGALLGYSTVEPDWCCVQTDGAIECNNEMQVVALDFADNEKFAKLGLFPEAILQLSHLEKINISSNGLDGELPTFSNSSKLRDVRAFSNRFHGTLPPFPESLEYLDLHSNSFSGTLPKFDSNIQMRTLDFFQNDLTGTIPNYDHLVHLSGLMIDENGLTGKVPSFEHNPALMMLCLDTNQLIGTLPSFSNNPKLMCLDAHSNKLSGTIPSFSKNKMLQKLTLRNNSFSGSLEDFEENLKLRVLDLRNNQMSGTLPEFAQVNMTSLRLSSNLISGVIPELKSLAKLEILDLSNNKFTGPIFSSLLSSTDGRLQQLQDVQLANNRLKGPPQETELTLAKNLAFLDLSDNELTGVLAPPDIQTRIASVDLRGNSFVCPLPVQDPAVNLQTSSCTTSFAQFITDPTLVQLSAAFGSALALFLLFLLVGNWFLSKLCGVRISHVRKKCLYLGGWIGNSLDLFSDIAMNVYLFGFFRADFYCDGLNSRGLFFSRLPNEYMLEEKQFPDASKFDSFAEYVKMISTKFVVPSENIEWFRRQCNEDMNGCIFSAESNTCIQKEGKVESFLEKNHQGFITLVYVSFALICVKEILKTAVIMFLVKKQSGVPRNLIMICRNSVLSPLLLFAFKRSISVNGDLFAASRTRREQFVKKMVLFEPSATDVLIQLVSEFLLEGFLQLGVALYFVFRVAQTGFSGEVLVSVLITVLSCLRWTYAGLKLLLCRTRSLVLKDPFSGDILGDESFYYKSDNSEAEYADGTYLRLD